MRPIKRKWSVKHSIGWYLRLLYVTHMYGMYSNCLEMSWNVNSEVSGQSLYINMNKNKPLYQKPPIWFKTKGEFLYAAVHWSHCLAWKIQSCQLPVEWPDSKSVARLWKQACLRGTRGTRCRATADPNPLLHTALSPVHSRCQLTFLDLFHLNADCSHNWSKQCVAEIFFILSESISPAVCPTGEIKLFILM